MPRPSQFSETFPKSYHDTNSSKSEFAVVCLGKQRTLQRTPRKVHFILHRDCLDVSILQNIIRLDAGLKTITTSIQKFGEVIVESKPCELTFARKKDKQAQLMVADLSPPISVDNIQLNLKQKINIKGRSIRGCSFLPDSRIVLSCFSTDTISFINKEGVEIF
jgi:hypothetical protein